jgi:hypothetical protein
MVPLTIQRLRLKKSHNRSLGNSENIFMAERIALALCNLGQYEDGPQQMLGINDCMNVCIVKTKRKRKIPYKMSGVRPPNL